ncbi:hypothetical protein PF005_g33599 [Phytophthora fragariae]|uniref:Uncharacterized protein n=1 Tax=Phytophthora fragariae TaxID=53985 RepID=A0A6A4ADQ1_9STRA|nr:hypothetical protein PF009_g33377 [Phytophthora fragariae]KAE8951245.1 hypothetical protein PF011_g33020 [Phytophthora fragariae]KAE9049556.1 hypothetical protein PF010_g33198 [Phytophthora fragariae]KAE9053270.1 hypothetical protein PF007_g32997 [Phytophthora fragariae]KAE9053724.1 hypothetical protein PF006_g33468 [Phytophthora fragariae]
MEVNVAFNMTADMAEPYNSYVTDLQSVGPQHCNKWASALKTHTRH